MIHPKQLARIGLPGFTHRGNIEETPHFSVVRDRPIAAASTAGDPVSLGCLRTVAARARWLIETMPLGAPVLIRA